VSVGESHTVAIKSNGALWAWGLNDHGQLGDNTTDNRDVPTYIGNAGDDWVSVRVGANHTVAIKSNGTLWAWGLNNHGQLGIAVGDTADKNEPTRVTEAGDGWVSVTAGGGDMTDQYGTVIQSGHTVAIKSNGELYAWGQNDFGQLGDDTNGTEAEKHVPTQESTGATDWESVSAGGGHTVAIKSNGELYAWGYNDYGRLGDNTTVNRDVPTHITAAGDGWESVSAGINHTLAIKSSDGALYAWGRNRKGQLGDGTLVIQRRFPVQITAAGDGWASVSAGGQHTAAVKTDDSLWMWGYNDYGQLGNGTTTNKDVPTQESTLAIDWSSISAGQFHNAAIKSGGPLDGTLWTWGSNSSGQLGDGTSVAKTVPVEVPAGGGLTWLSVTTGVNYTAAIRSDRTLWTWGYNVYGQLGNGNTGTSSRIPVQEDSNAADWVSVASGGWHTAAIRGADGNRTLWAWGRNGYGQLGNTHSADVWVPTQEGTGEIDWSSVSTGDFHTVAIRSGVTLWGWGDNEYGQLGDGSTTHGNNGIPVQENEGYDWESVSGGDWHTVAIRDDGTLWAWGLNDHGQVHKWVTEPTQLHP